MRLVQQTIGRTAMTVAVAPGPRRRAQPRLWALALAALAALAARACGGLALVPQPVPEAGTIASLLGSLGGHMSDALVVSKGDTEERGVWAKEAITAGGNVPPTHPTFALRPC